MNYDALDIARFIVNYSNEKGYGISNLKLQKILYFVQAAFLTNNDEQPCFDDEIEAWSFGPVVASVYQEFKEFGSGNIPKITSYEEFDSENWTIDRVEFDKSIIDAESRKIIEKIVDGLKKYSATDLVNITHRQTPWKEAYQPGCNREITPKAIKEYFLNEG